MRTLWAFFVLISMSVVAGEEAAMQKWMDDNSVAAQLRVAHPDTWAFTSSGGAQVGIVQGRAWTHATFPTWAEIQVMDTPENDSWWAARDKQNIRDSALVEDVEALVLELRRLGVNVTIGGTKDQRTNTTARTQ